MAPSVSIVSHLAGHAHLLSSFSSNFMSWAAVCLSWRHLSLPTLVLLLQDATIDDESKCCPLCNPIAPNWWQIENSCSCWLAVLAWTYRVHTLRTFLALSVCRTALRSFSLVPYCDLLIYWRCRPDVVSSACVCVLFIACQCVWAIVFSLVYPLLSLGKKSCPILPIPCHFSVLGVPACLMITVCFPFSLTLNLWQDSDCHCISISLLCY